MNRNIQNRKQLYKSPSNSANSWKDVYRKKCFERLRSRRASLIEHFRFSNTSPSKALAEETTSPSKLVSDVMEVEWTAIHQNRCFPSLNTQSSGGFAFQDESDDEETREILNQIQRELTNEDEMLMNEFLQCDSDDLNSKIEMLEKEEVICPICKVRKLEELRLPRHSASVDSFRTPERQNSSLPWAGTVQCLCGLTLSSPDLTLTRVRSALSSAIADHEGGCVAPLQFSLTDDAAGTNVLITCSSCEWMTFLL